MNINGTCLLFGVVSYVLCLWASFSDKIYIRGWQKVDKNDPLIFFLMGCIFIAIAIFYKPKHSDFSRCKKCHKVYNYTDVKDKNNICPKCGGVLQDYAEFEKNTIKGVNKDARNKVINPSFFAPKNTNKNTKMPKQEKPIKASKDKTNKALTFKNVKLKNPNSNKQDE